MVIGFPTNYLCNQCISPLTLWVRIPLRRGVLDTALCDCGRSVVFSCFLHRYIWPQRYNWHIVESGIKHHSSNPMFIVCIYFSAPPYNSYQNTQPSDGSMYPPPPNMAYPPPPPNYGPPPSYPGNQQYDIKSSWPQRGRLIVKSVDCYSVHDNRCICNYSVLNNIYLYSHTAKYNGTEKNNNIIIT
jgi:hypothetical protein